LERADDGKFYCDACWSKWQHSSQVQRQNWGSGSAARAPGESRSSATQEVMNDAQSRLRAERSDKKRKEAEAKEKLYWAARREVANRLIREPVVGQPSAVSSGDDAKVPVVFWGICDLKFDPRKPTRDQVKVLELGDGRASRFSHHGAALKEAFDSNYVMDPAPLRRGVMVDNKRFTHDTFVDCGLAHLRPKQLAYPRRFAADLADRIREDLGVARGGFVVLKLVNRARGAGVVVCPEAELDATLRKLLMPPVGNALNQWLSEKSLRVLSSDPRPAEVLAEQQLHYWSNESPVFVAEELCHSVPVPMPPTGTAAASSSQPAVVANGAYSAVPNGAHSAVPNGALPDVPDGAGSGQDHDHQHHGDGEEVFDGTMRVAFALRRGSEDPDRLALDWLGGYWKLPPHATRRGGEGSEEEERHAATLEEAHAEIVSSFNSEEKRTAPVADAHLLEVYAALEPALVSVFEVQRYSPRDLHFAYPDDPNFRAFAIARCSAALRPDGDFQKCNFVLEQAKKLLVKSRTNDGQDIPERSVLSYIHRSMGVNWAIRGDWVKASEFFREALAAMPTNATAMHLHGVALQEMGKHQEAVAFQLRSLTLDPDFRSPLMALGDCWTRLRRYDQAIEACQLCLQRQPDAPVAQFHMGQAIYCQLREGGGGASDADKAERRARGQKALEIARNGLPQNWTDEDDQILRYLQQDNPDDLPEVPLRSWKSYGYRP